MESTRGQLAYDHLRRKLSRGELPPGSRLVNRTLAKEMGISFTPVREAINRLASEGLVDYVPGAGAFVRAVDRQDLAQLYDLRENFEPFAASEAAAHATSYELDELQAICDDFHNIARSIRSSPTKIATAEQMARWMDNDARFHDLLFRASRNRWLVKIARDLRLMALAFTPLRSEPDFLTLSHAANTWRTHTSLLRALRNRNADDARQRMTHQIRIGREEVLSYFDQKHRDTVG